MNHMRRYVLLVVVLTILTGIGLLLVVFERNQAELTLEGNGLRSPASISVTNSNSDLESLDRDSDTPLAFYRQLDDSGIVNIVRSSDFDRFQYPVHQGRSFKQTDDQVALVGSGVTVEHRAAGAYYAYNGESYEVVGTLGRQAESLLVNSILIVDDSLFAQLEGDSTYIDGPNVEEVYSSHQISGEFFHRDQSTNRRTSVDFIFPTIIVLGNIIQGAGAVCLGLLIAALFRDQNHLAWVLGVSRNKIVSRTVVFLIVPSLTYFSVGCWFGISILGTSFAGEIVGSLAWPLLLAIGSLLAATIINMKRSISWN